MSDRAARLSSDTGFDARDHDDHCELDDKCGCIERANEDLMWELEHTDRQAENAIDDWEASRIGEAP